MIALKVGQKWKMGDGRVVQISKIGLYGIWIQAVGGGSAYLYQAQEFTDSRAATLLADAPDAKAVKHGASLVDASINAYARKYADASTSEALAAFLRSAEQLIESGRIDSNGVAFPVGTIVDVLDPWRREVVCFRGKVIHYGAYGSYDIRDERKAMHEVNVRNLRAVPKDQL
jgi:hypothetical protein